MQSICNPGNNIPGGILFKLNYKGFNKSIILCLEYKKSRINATFCFAKERPNGV